MWRGTNGFLTKCGAACNEYIKPCSKSSKKLRRSVGRHHPQHLLTHSHLRLPSSGLRETQHESGWPMQSGSETPPSCPHMSLHAAVETRILTARQRHVVHLAKHAAYATQPCITCHSSLAWHDDLTFLSKAVYQAMSQLGVSAEQELPEMLDNLRRVNITRHVQLRNGS